jgi:hypothetical protein
MMEKVEANPDLLRGLGIVGYEVAFALLGMLTNKGILTSREGLEIIETALSSVEAKQGETPDASLQQAIDILGIHQAMFVERREG